MSLYTHTHTHNYRTDTAAVSQSWDGGEGARGGPGGVGTADKELGVAWGRGGEGKRCVST